MLRRLLRAASERLWRGEPRSGDTSIADAVAATVPEEARTGPDSDFSRQEIAATPPNDDVITGAPIPSDTGRAVPASDSGTTGLSPVGPGGERGHWRSPAVLVAMCALGVTIVGGAIVAWGDLKSDLGAMRARQEQASLRFEALASDVRADIEREVDGVRRDLQRHRDFHDGRAGANADPVPAEDPPPDHEESGAENPTDAERRLDERCRRGEGLSCYRLGRRRELGLEDTETRPVLAVTAYAAACQRQYALGCYRYARALRFGVGAERRPTEASELFARACDGGVADACDARGLMRERGTDGRSPSLVEALEMYLRGCELGGFDACVNAGYALWNVSDPARDRRRARRLYEHACTSGNARGCVMLAQIAERGLGAPRDPDLAAEYREQACQLGDQTACAEPAARSE